MARAKPDPPKKRPNLAYIAHDGGDGWCVVFARSGAEARRDVWVPREANC